MTRTIESEVRKPLAQDGQRARQLATQLRVGRVLVKWERFGLETFLEYQSVVA
jgi:hypothetical protein